MKNVNKYMLLQINTFALVAEWNKKQNVFKWVPSALVSKWKSV